MAKQGKKIMSFYDYMIKFYLKDPDRYALAYALRRLAPGHKEVKQIDSMTDLMIVADMISDPDARAAATGSLWCEYCCISGHPMPGEE